VSMSMSMNGRRHLAVSASAPTALVCAASTRSSAQQSGPMSVSIGERDLGGVVRSARGPEAGVWVIAETTDLPTTFAKMAVTDD
jgi:hypothetical protein